MSKLSFRARTLDSFKKMPIFSADELPDLSDYVSINRSVPQMPTGMEKEEEMEYHLQQAINAQQASSSGAISSDMAPSVIIPIPRVTPCDSAHFDRCYPGDFKLPKPLIRVQAALNLENEYPEYDLDLEDEQWLKYVSHSLKMDITPLQFEKIMDTLEKQSEYQVISPEAAKLLLQEEDDDVVFAVYDYWLNKRYKFTAQGRHLIPRVRVDRRGDSAGSVADPYVGFRRRAEKMQTRKNRKNDEESYEKILKLRHDLQKALTLLEMVKRREKSKRELIKLSLELAQKRREMNDFSGEIYNHLKQEVKPSFQFSKEEMLIGRVRNRNRKRKGRLSGDNASNSSFNIENSALNYNVNNNLNINSNLNMNIKNNKELVSREWLLENAEQWHKPALFPSKSLNSQFPSPFSPNDVTCGSSMLLDKNVTMLQGQNSSVLTPRSDNHVTKETDEQLIADGRYTFKRRRGCVYLAPLEDKRGQSKRAKSINVVPDWSSLVTKPANREEPADDVTEEVDKRCWPWEERKARFRYTRGYLHSRLPYLPDDEDAPCDDHGAADQSETASKPAGLRFVGLVRRRMGRGGRILYDRVSSPKELRDYTTYSASISSSLASTTQKNASSTTATATVSQLQQSKAVARVLAPPPDHSYNINSSSMTSSLLSRDPLLIRPDHHQDINDSMSSENYPDFYYYPLISSANQINSSNDVIMSSPFIGQSESASMTSSSLMTSSLYTSNNNNDKNSCKNNIFNTNFLMKKNNNNFYNINNNTSSSYSNPNFGYSKPNTGFSSPNLGLGLSSISTAPRLSTSIAQSLLKTNEHNNNNNIHSYSTPKSNSAPSSSSTNRDSTALVTLSGPHGRLLADLKVGVSSKIYSPYRDWLSRSTRASGSSAYSSVTNPNASSAPSLSSLVDSSTIQPIKMQRGGVNVQPEHENGKIRHYPSSISSHVIASGSHVTAPNYKTVSHLSTNQISQSQLINGGGGGDQSATSSSLSFIPDSQFSLDNLDSRRVFEATAAVMTARQVQQLAEHYQKLITPAVSTVNCNGNHNYNNNNDVISTKNDVTNAKNTGMNAKRDVIGSKNDVINEKTAADGMDTAAPGGLKRKTLCHVISVFDHVH